MSHDQGSPSCAGDSQHDPNAAALCKEKFKILLEFYSQHFYNVKLAAKAFKALEVDYTAIREKSLRRGSNRTSGFVV